MSLTLHPLDAGGRAAPRRLVLAAAALVAAAVLLAIIGWALSSGAPPQPPARNPFGLGPREAAPATSGVWGFILAWQAQFYRSLTAALGLLRREEAGVWPLVAVSFAYGVFHAAGPGHGKAVIAGHILASDSFPALRAFLLSLAAALVQAAVAVGLVLVVFLIFKATALTMGRATTAIEFASFAAIAAVGLWALWRKAGVLTDALQGDAVACAPGCGHAAALAGPGRGWLRDLAVAVTAGIRPCAGALIVLTLALSQGIMAAGVAAVIAMALGVAVTTGGLALLAVAFKRLALRLAGGRGQTAAIVVRALECLAAALVAVFGAALLFGLWASGAS